MMSCGPGLWPNGTPKNSRESSPARGRAVRGSHTPGVVPVTSLSTLHLAESTARPIVCRVCTKCLTLVRRERSECAKTIRSSAYIRKCGSACTCDSHSGRSASNTRNNGARYQSIMREKRSADNADPCMIPRCMGMVLSIPPSPTFTDVPNDSQRFGTGLTGHQPLVHRLVRDAVKGRANIKFSNLSRPSY